MGKVGVIGGADDEAVVDGMVVEGQGLAGLELKSREQEESAPALETPVLHARCRYLHASGAQCRGTSIRGQFYCHSHGGYRRTRRRSTMTIPLLEDDVTILLVLSQVAQAMAEGSIPPANARVVQQCCHSAQGVLNHRLEKQKFAARQARHGLAVTETAEEPVTDPVEVDGELMAPASEAETKTEADGNGAGASTATTSVETAAETSGAEAEAGCARGEAPPFPGARAQWDRALARTEGSMTDLHRERREAQPFSAKGLTQAQLEDIYFGRVNADGTPVAAGVSGAAKESSVESG